MHHHDGSVFAQVVFALASGQSKFAACKEIHCCDHYPVKDEDAPSEAVIDQLLCGHSNIVEIAECPDGKKKEFKEKSHTKISARKVHISGMQAADLQEILS